MPAAGTTKAEHSKRISRIETLLLDGASTSEIVRFGSKNWHIGRRAIQKYITAATKRIERVLDVKRETHIATATRRFNRLYAKAVKAQDHRGAAQIQKAQNELLGLNAPNKMELTGKDGMPLLADIKRMSDAELVALAQQLAGSLSVGNGNAGTPTETGAGAVG